MKPPYNITPKILELISSISEKLGKVNAIYLDKPSAELRKQNKVKTIHSSLNIEGNTLTEEQITALLENKTVLGPKKDIIEVLNAIEIYEGIETYVFRDETSFLQAHENLMKNLISEAGKYRTQSVGIVKGKEIAHVAPPWKNIPHLMNNLFDYIKRSDEIELIKSCVFHYETAFIHPFLDGNGRMARLWQTLILMDKYPIFEFLPFESMISNNQNEYYEALGKSDKVGNSTFFIEYMLAIIDKSLNKFIKAERKNLTAEERLEYFISLKIKEFSRKDYMNVLQNISSATASRDLRKGVELKLFEKSGLKNKTKYHIVNI